MLGEGRERLVRHQEHDDRAGLAARLGADEIEPMVMKAGSLQSPSLWAMRTPVPPEPPTTSAPLMRSGTMKAPLANPRPSS